MTDLDPFTLAARQIDADRAATGRFPFLFERKKQRLGSSVHAFLRGTAGLFYDALAARPDLAAGPAGDGWLVGDMHMENVGAYRDDAGDVVFGLNDFDDASIGPLRIDVLRLATSVLLAGQGIQATGAQSIALVEGMIAAYLAARGGAAPPPPPAPVAALMVKVKDRSMKQLLDDRATSDHGRRRFVRGERYRDLPPDIEARVPALLAAYVKALGDRAPARCAEWKIDDAAFRIAGNGSLGALRVALLVSDHAGDERLVELKEARDTATAALFAPPAGKWTHDAERCVFAARALCARPPRLLAPLRHEDLSFVGRRLFPQEDKVDLRHLRDPAELADLVHFIGHILGASHARGVVALGSAPPPAWSKDEIALVVDHAVSIAGLLGAVYLAWSRRAG